MKCAARCNLQFWTKYTEEKWEIIELKREASGLINRKYRLLRYASINPKRKEEEKSSLRKHTSARTHTHLCLVSYEQLGETEN